MIINVSFLQDTWDTKPVTMTRHWRVISDWLCTPSQGSSKKELAMWSPCTFEGSSKKLADAKEVSCMTYDMDEGMYYDYHTKFSRWTYCIHTSWSHSYCTPKWRLVLPLAEPVPAADWAYAYEAGLQLFAEVTGYPDLLDEVCKNPNRFYYGPAINPDARPQYEGFQSDSNDGELLKLEYGHIKAQRDKDKEERQKASKEALRRLREAKYTGKRSQDRAARQIIAQDSSVRLKLASQLGATITPDGQIARGILCPNAAAHKQGAKSHTVWFTIDPVSAGVSHYARCNHVDSCGWAADLLTLTKSI